MQCPWGSEEDIGIPRAQVVIASCELLCRCSKKNPGLPEEQPVALNNWAISLAPKKRLFLMVCMWEGVPVEARGIGSS